MIIDKGMLAVLEVSGKGDPVYSLDCVHFAENGVTATNGHMLVHVEPGPLPDEEFPVLPGTTHGTPGFEPFCADADGLAKVRKALKGLGKSTMPILETARLDDAATRQNGTAVFQLTDLENPQIISVHKADKQFPSWERLVPKCEPTIRIGLNIDYLAALLKVAKECDGGKLGHLTLEITTAENPVKVLRQGCDRFTGVIMPVQVREDEPTA
jgi:hypothetical protein